jgi:amino acid permease
LERILRVATGYLSRSEGHHPGQLQWFPQIPEWLSAGAFLVLITIINLTAVRAYGEFEFWFAVIKVVAILAMIVLGVLIIATGLGGGPPTGIGNLVRLIIVMSTRKAPADNHSGICGNQKLTYFPTTVSSAMETAM